MRARLVRIGNSRGVRLPKALLQEVGLTDDLELSVEGGALVIRPSGKPRAGWAESIDKYGIEGEGLLLDFPNRFDDEEWEWK